MAVSFLMMLALAECALRVTGFHYQLAPEKVEFGWPDPVTLEEMYRPDSELFWVPKSYDATLARARNGTPLDIAFLGDSCTEFGDYQSGLVTRLQQKRPGLKLKVANFGVGGWSSYQGMRQFDRDIAALKPKVATIYFGWNDHWIGFGIQDKSLKAPGDGFWGLGNSRLSQLWLKATLGLRNRQQGGRPERVSPEDYRANLSDIVGRARAQGIVPVLITAPSSHQVGKEPEITPRFLRHLSDLVPLHQRYVTIVREVAEREDAQLCDIARRFESLSPEKLTGEYFYDDGIHLYPPGNEVLAGYLLDCFVASEEIRKLWALDMDP